jgi:uncharacterized repeat protein (TIGR03847 family)
MEPEFTYDLDQVTRITAHAVGQPGQRVFYIQARRGNMLVSLIAEKEQINALAQVLEQFLDQLAEENPLLSSADDMLPLINMNLEEPLEPRFRISQMQLGYDADRDLVVLLIQGLTNDEEEESPSARFCATREQMRALSRHASEVVSKGRRICGNCARPIDPTGHFCPRMN